MNKLCKGKNQLTGNSHWNWKEKKHWIYQVILFNYFIQNYKSTLFLVNFFKKYKTYVLRCALTVTTFSLFILYANLTDEIFIHSHVFSYTWISNPKQGAAIDSSSIMKPHHFQIGSCHLLPLLVQFAALSLVETICLFLQDLHNSCIWISAMKFLP